jgi:hypothetical protein
MIPMDWIDLDIVTATSESHRDSWGATSPAHSPLTRECLGKGRCRCVDPGAIVKEKSQHQSPDFQKAPDRKPKQHRVASSHQRTEKTKTNRQKLPIAGLHFL